MSARTQADEQWGLEVLARLAQLDCQVQQTATWLATSMRSRGTTWEAIGTAVGTTRQGAHWRYGREPKVCDQAEEGRAS